MAHGAPDWWSRSYIDILGQTLAYLTQRPYYGDAKAIDKTIEISTSGWTNLINLQNCKGRVLGGYMKTVDPDYSTILFELYIDGELALDVTDEILWKDGCFIGSATPLRILTYSPDEPRVAIDFLPGIQWESSFLLKARTTGADIVDMEVKFIYATT